MNDLVTSAIACLFLSGVAMIWGIQYRSDHQMAALGGMFGRVDQTFEAAGWAITLGIFGFLIGIALLTAGLIRGASTRAKSDVPRTRKPTRPSSDND